MNQIFMKARAKINVSLDVIGKRDDGYHDIETIMQTLSLHDSLVIKKIQKENYFKMVTNIPWLPTDERNIVSKAFFLMRDRYSLDYGVFIELTKNIPISAGLGGGSADCAAVLTGISRLFELNLDKDELFSLARELGADVPFCVEGGTMLARGTGDELIRIAPHPYTCVLLIKPPCIVSTADVFKNLNMDGISKRPDTQAIVRHIENADAAAVARSFCNVLETYTARKHPIIEDIKAAMIESGALGASMSGSGPTVFGYFNSPSEAASALQDIRSKGIAAKESRITKISNTVF